MSKADEQENLNTYIPSLTPSPLKKKKKAFRTVTFRYQSAENKLQ